MLNDIFQYARKQGMAKLEEDVEKPDASQLFGKYPKFLKDHHALAFVCDTLRTSLSGVVPPFELDQLMETEMDVHHHESNVPVAALATVADALPGLGIVAAVLGVVITMGAIGGPPEEIGHKVAAALVGTFLGILLCYGFLGPARSQHDQDQRRRVTILQLGCALDCLPSQKGWRPPLAWSSRAVRFRLTFDLPLKTWKQLPRAALLPAAVTKWPIRLNQNSRPSTSSRKRRVVTADIMAALGR